MLISRSLPGVPAVDVVLRDGTNTLTADWDVGAHKIENVVDPANPQDVATKNYVDTNGGGNQIFWLTTETWADVYAKISASPGEAFNVVIPRGQMTVTPGAPPTYSGPFVIPPGLYNLDYVSFCSTGPFQLWPMGPAYADLVIEAGAVLGDNLRFDNLYVFAGDGIIPGTTPVRLELNNSQLEPLDPAQGPMGVFTNSTIANTILWNGQGNYFNYTTPTAPMFSLDPTIFLFLNMTGEVFLPANFLSATGPGAIVQLNYTSATWLADNFGTTSIDPVINVTRLRYDGLDITPLAAYATTTATIASPQPVAWLNWEPSLTNYEGHDVRIYATLSSTDPAEVAAFMLFNLTTTTYVEIGGPGVTILSVTGTAPSQVVSERLNDGSNPMAGFNPFNPDRYELQIFTSNAAFPAILGNATLTRF
jgi:hypothetical protein